MWFGMAILSSAVVGFGVSAILGGGGPQWHRTFEGGKRVLAARFAEVWDDPVRRSDLAREMSDEMGLDVTVRSADGEVLQIAGREECYHTKTYLEPKRNGAPLGRVDLCSEPPAMRFAAGFIGLAAAVGVLWLVAHKVARRLGRPILDLVHVTDAIGRGEYDVKIEPRRHAPIEILHLNGAVRDMAAKIKQQLADQRELLASVSHELRSPLARIRLLLEMMRDEELPVERRASYIEELEHEVVEIDDLVGGLLAQSRLDFSAVSVRPNDLVSSAERALSRASLELKPIVTGEPKPIRYDATLIARAVGNLLENAKGHGGGATGINVRFEEDRATIEVEDRGPGLADGDAEKIFDSFYGNGSGSHDSLGLGLSLVKRIAQAHGGDAFAKNRDQGGALVGFWIRAA